MRWIIVMSLMVLTGLLAACGDSGGDGIEEITPISQTELAALPTHPPTATPTITPTFSAFEAMLATQTAQAPTLTSLPDLPQGEPRKIAQATDTAFRPTPRNAVTFDQNPVLLKFDEFYDDFDLRTGLVLSDKLVSLDGKQVIIEGYMAPPLKVRLDFFVLTRIRLQFCPFCSTAAEWPNDIALIYMPEGEEITAKTDAIRVHGRLEVGISQDLETGMVSLVRIYADEVEVLN